MIYNFTVFQYIDIYNYQYIQKVLNYLSLIISSFFHKIILFLLINHFNLIYQHYFIFLQILYLPRIILQVYKFFLLLLIIPNIFLFMNFKILFMEFFLILSHFSLHEEKILFDKHMIFLALNLIILRFIYLILLFLLKLGHSLLFDSVYQNHKKYFINFQFLAQVIFYFILLEFFFFH